MTDSLTFTNSFSEMFSPLLILIRSTGFFEAYIFIPVMTVTAVALFFRLQAVIKLNGTFNHNIRASFPKLWQFSYFTLCFITTNSTAVAFKTMIVEETDYTTAVWYLPLVSPLHFYITSVAGTMLWLVWRNRSAWIDRSVCLYIQLGFLGGYYVAWYRLVNEPFELFDPTSGVSGVFFFIWVGLLNWDIALRYISSEKKQGMALTKAVEHRG